MFLTWRITWPGCGSGGFVISFSPAPCKVAAPLGQRYTTCGSRSAAKAAVTPSKGKTSKIRRRSVLRSIIANHLHQFSAASGSERANNNTHMAEKNTLATTRHAESETSENQLQRQLNLARTCTLGNAAHDTEASGVINLAARRAELGTIESIEKLSAELDVPFPFAEIVILE